MQAEGAAKGAFVPQHVGVVHDPDEAEPSEDVRKRLRARAAQGCTHFFLLDRYDRYLEGAGT